MFLLVSWFLQNIFDDLEPNIYWVMANFLPKHLPFFKIFSGRNGMGGLLREPAPKILQTSLHGGPQIFLKFCTHSYISERNLPWKFQLSDAYGCRDMNTLRFETKPRFAKSRKRKIAIISEIFIKNLQIFF